MNESIVIEIRKAVLDMMSKIEYTDDGHTYKRKDTGDWLQGVSSVSSIVPKDWLSAWGAKECAKFLGYSDYEGDIERAEEVLEIIRNLKPTDKSVPQLFIELLKEAKGASGRKSKTALLDGKAGHKWLEKYVKAKIRGTKLPFLPESALKRPLNQFIEWSDKEVDYWILSEARVAYLEKGYAGTMDGLAMMKSGKLAVIDFKFANHFSSDYKLQTAGYQATFEPYEIKIDERIIIRLPKTLLREEWNTKEHKYEMKENTIEIMILKDTYEWDRDAFFLALPIKKWINNELKVEKN